MDKSEILTFLNANQVCFLATVEGTLPRVRGMMLYRADEHGIIFHSGQGKEVCEQLAINPSVEICVFNQQDMVQVRVSGTAEFLDDLALKKEIVAARPFMQPMVDQFGYDPLLVFRVKDCTATVWTMATNMESKSYVKL